MGQNVGSFDRTVRFIVGIFLLGLTIFGPKTPWGIVGLIPLTTSLLGYSPIYRFFGISTRRRPKTGAV